MWVATRVFRYRGKDYQPGDTVPAEEWANRTALVKTRRIKLVEESTPGSVRIPDENLEKMKRDDLNKYAKDRGIEDPTSFSKKEDLVEAIIAFENPAANIVPPVSTELPAVSVDPPTGDDPLIPTEDDMFKDPLLDDTVETPTTVGGEDDGGENPVNNEAPKDAE